MDTPPAAQRETLQAIAGEVANLATDLAQLAHALSDVDESLQDSEILVRIHTTKALWARDALLNVFYQLRDDNS
jgi:hypothetical protein